MELAAIGDRRVWIWVVTALAISASVAFVAHRVAVPNDAASIPFYSGAWRPDGVAVEPLPGSGSGLRSGDIVRSIAGTGLSTWIDRALDSTVARPDVASAPRLTYGVTRDEVAIDVPVTLVRPDVSGVVVQYWSTILFVVVLQVVAGYVLLRRPDAQAATALALVAVGVTGSTAPWFLGLVPSDTVEGWPFLLYAATAGGIYMVLWPAGTLHLPLALTRPELLNRRILAAIYGLPLLAYAAGMAVARLASPTAAAWVGTWASVQGIVIVPLILIGVGLTAWCYRTADRHVRAQTRWLTAGATVSVVASLVLLFLPQLVTGAPLVPWSSVGLFALPLPLGVAAAILRYGLLDIEVVVNRALVYGGATATIAGVYVASVTVLGRALGVGTGLSVSLLATGLAAVAAIPVRDALQGVVNRVMYGDRDDPYRALVRLGRGLEGSLDPLEAPAIIVRTVSESLRVPRVELRIETGAGPRSFVHGPEVAGQPTTLPLVYGSERLGELVVAQRTPAEPLSSADVELLEGLARQVASAVRAMALTLELVESRERIVAAREEERRRIRRDLHDGLGPTLAAIGLRAELAADLVTRDPGSARGVLEEMRGEAGAAIAEIRRLVDALRPPALDELGLVGALEAQAARLGPRPAISVAADGRFESLPAAVEVAAYRIAVEAMTNAARHANATTCRVGISLDSVRDVVRIDVVDDGPGLPSPLRPGIGIASMRERAAEVGGRCEVARRASGGTRVRAILPLALPGSEPLPDAV